MLPNSIITPHHSNMLGDLNQNSLTKIFDSLIHKQNMAILDVSANGILGPDGNRLKSIAHLCKVVMPTMPTLIHLDLSYNELHCEVIVCFSGCVYGGKAGCAHMAPHMCTHAHTHILTVSYRP